MHLVSQSFGHRMQGNSPKTERLVNMSHVLLVARNSVERLCAQSVELSERSRIAKKTIADFERGNRAYHPKTPHAVKVALESNGVIFIPENGGGVGVRLQPPAVK